MLETKDLTIRFGGHVAVNARLLRLHAGHADGDRRAERRGQDHLLQPDLGPAARRAPAACTLERRATSPALPASSARRAGLGRAFQLTNLFPRLTVLENVRLAVQAAREGRTGAA